jgi:fatty acid desaturase
VDWPTIAVAAATYGGFGLLTWFYQALPWWLVLVGGGYIVCLHGSLQHEAVHGQPFRRRWLNGLLVFPSLWLWLPYTLYRETHLVHHRNERLTHPVDDPESNYVSPVEWAAMGWFHRRYRIALGLCAGRLLLGPPYAVWVTARISIRRVLGGDVEHLRHWLLHVPAVAAVLAWTIGVCGIPFWEYVLLFAYPGLSLTLFRSYLEHRAAKEVGDRTVIVEAGPVMSLLYLHNNLHALHHLEPATVWHRRPERYRVRRDEVLAWNSGYRFDGYGEILARYLFRAKEPVIHPLGEV